MLLRSRIAVVIPAHNESALIERTLTTMPAYVDHLIVVDDGSTDDTAAHARRVCDPRVQIIRHPRNRGVGAALCTGYRAAFAAGADVAAVMAADAQMDPSELERVVAPVAAGAVDYCKGDRLSHPEVQSRMPRLRWIGNRILSWATSLCLGVTVRDSQCGYTAMSRTIAARINLAALWPGYGYPNDLLSRLVLAGAEIRETVVRPVYGDEKSGVRLRHALVVVPFVILRCLARRVPHAANRMAPPRPAPEEAAVALGEPGSIDGFDRSCESGS